MCSNFVPVLPTSCTVSRPVPLGLRHFSRPNAIPSETGEQTKNMIWRFVSHAEACFGRYLHERKGERASDREREREREKEMERKRESESERARARARERDGAQAREREMERKRQRASEEALPFPRSLRFSTLLSKIQNASLLACTPVPGENAVAGGMKYIRNGGAPFGVFSGQHGWSNRLEHVLSTDWPLTDLDAAIP
jgi:hypothetical protein